MDIFKGQNINRLWKKNSQVMMLENHIWKN